MLGPNPSASSCSRASMPAPTGAIARKPFRWWMPRLHRLSTRSRNRRCALAGGGSSARDGLGWRLRHLSGRLPLEHQALIGSRIPICKPKPWMLDLEGRGGPWAGSDSTGEQSNCARPCGPHSSPGMLAPQSCWLAAAVSAPRLNSETNGSHGHRAGCKLLPAAPTGPESGHGRVCAGGRGPARAWFPTPFCPVPRTGICWFALPRPPLACCVSASRRCGPGWQPHGSSCCRTIPGAGGVLAEAQCASDNPSRPHFPLARPRSSTPAIRILVRQARSPCDKANRSRQSASWQQA